jgi:hypothetical protein
LLKKQRLLPEIIGSEASRLRILKSRGARKSECRSYQTHAWISKNRRWTVNFRDVSAWSAAFHGRYFSKVMKANSY